MMMIHNVVLVDGGEQRRVADTCVLGRRTGGKAERLGAGANRCGNAANVAGQVFNLICWLDHLMSTR